MIKVVAVLFLSQLLLVASLRDPPPGINNLGASCYSNSLLQVLFHLPTIRERVIERVKRAKEVVLDPRLTDIESALGQAFLQMSETTEQAVNLRTTFYDEYSRFIQQNDVGLSAWGQDDAAAFFDVLINAAIPWARDLFHVASEVKYVYEGIEFLKRTENGSNYLWIKEEHCPGTTCSLEAACNAALRGITEDKMVYRFDYDEDRGAKVNAALEERLGGWGKKANIQATRHYSIRGPILMVGFVPRMKQVLVKQGSVTMLNTQARLIYPEVMELPSGTYHLHSFVYAAYGHYFTYAKVDVRENKWYRLNDSQVAPILSSEALEKNNNAYLLFYVREDLLEQWKRGEWNWWHERSPLDEGPSHQQSSSGDLINSPPSSEGSEDEEFFSVEEDGDWPLDPSTSNEEQPSDPQAKMDTPPDDLETSKHELLARGLEPPGVIPGVGPSSEVRPRLQCRVKPRPGSLPRPADRTKWDHLSPQAQLDLATTKPIVIKQLTYDPLSKYRLLAQELKTKQGEKRGMGAGETRH